MTMVCLLALPMNAHAKGPKPLKHDNGKDKKEKHYKESDRDGQDRQVYASHPRSGFVLTFGTGYAGRGYYYGPPNSRYFYERSDVRYYASREVAPREYFRNNAYPSGAMDSAVQRELARRGYYHGYIDGLIGPQSRRAIVGYQRDRGLRPTGFIDSSLLHSLGLQ
ncbi:MAG: peptidoglycan-binding protein [Akkermansiaceae bacterium]|nr:peptidoglycan-binding protein [Akkermansiaceae bacterium]